MTGEELTEFRQLLLEAAKRLERNELLSDDMRLAAAQTLRKWLAIDFYDNRNLLAEYERFHKKSGIETRQAAADMRLLGEAGKLGSNALSKAMTAIQARRENKNKAAALVDLLMIAEGLSAKAASEMAQKILDRDDPDSDPAESIRVQYQRYKKKMDRG